MHETERGASNPFHFIALGLLLLLGAGAPARAQRELGVRPTDSGGPLQPEQAAYDVKSYDLALKVNPADQSIAGALTVHALIVHPTAWLVLDLDTPLKVEAVTEVGQARGAAARPLEFERRGGEIWIAFPITRQRARLCVCVSHTGASRA